MIKKFKLDEYYNNHKPSILFFDTLIKERVLEKGVTIDEFLEDLYITPSSFRRVRAKNQPIGKEITEILLEEFNMNELKIEKKNKYENLLQKIYDYSYYRLDGILQFEDEIDECINDNNILKPIFILFKLLINCHKVTENYSKEAIQEKNKELYETVKKFNNGYYINAFVDLLFIIDVLYLRGNVDLEYANQILTNSDIKGMVSFAISSHFMMTAEYSNATYFSKKCEKYLVDDYNYNRLFILNVNLCSCYNKLGDYEITCDMAEKQIHASQVLGFKIVETQTIRVLMVAFLGLKKYKEIIDNMNEVKDKTFIEYIFLLLAYFKLYPKDYKFVIDQFNNRKIKNIEDKLFTIVLNYIENPCKINYNELNNSILNDPLKNIIYDNFGKRYKN